MKKYLLIIVALTLTVTAGAQGIEFRLKGGANFQRSKMADQEYSFLPQFGISAGVRLSSVGIYGEVAYSNHEGVNGLENISYIIPSANLRFYTYRFLYAEGGLGYLVMASDAEAGTLENIDKEVCFYAGFGATFKRFEIGIRTSTKPVTNIQFLAAIRF